MPIAQAKWYINVTIQLLREWSKLKLTFYFDNYKDDNNM